MNHSILGIYFENHVIFENGPVKGMFVCEDFLLFVHKTFENALKLFSLLVMA